jgi:hypothetical protein
MYSPRTTGTINVNELSPVSAHPVRGKCIPVELDAVTRPIRRDRHPVFHLQAVRDEPIEAKAVHFQIGPIGNRRKQVDVYVVRAM